VKLGAIGGCNPAGPHLPGGRDDHRHIDTGTAHAPGLAQQVGKPVYGFVINGKNEIKTPASMTLDRFRIVSDKNPSNGPPIARPRKTIETI